jgi:hypothetical protein
MTEPQAWTLIGVFAATLFGMLGALGAWFPRLLRAELSGVEGRLTGRIDSVESRLDAKIVRLDTKIDGVESRLDTKIDKLDAKLSAKIDLLDRGISVIARRIFPEEPT